MAKTDTTPKNNSQKQGERDKSKAKDGEQKKQGDKSKKKGSKDKKTEYQPGMSYLYDPCPHRVWTPKPGERDKSEPRGVGSPWYEPVKKKEDVDRERAEKNKKKEEKGQKKRQQAYEQKQKEKEEEDKKKKEEDQRRKEEEEKKTKEKEKKEKEKKRKENKKRKQQEEKRKKDKENKQKEEEENKKTGKDKKKDKEKPQASYMFDPCPHRVYTPGPGEKDMADPRGVGSPWYVPVRKKEDIDKEEQEKREEESKKNNEKVKKRQNEKKKEEERQVEEEKIEEERLRKEKEAKLRKRQKIIEQRKREEERKEMEHEEMGCGVRESRTDFTSELIWMMGFITEVDEQERARRGEALRWKKEELEEEIESHLAKEAHTRDLKELVSTFIEAEWTRADRQLTKLEKEERRRRRQLLQAMDPLAKDMLAEGKRTRLLYGAAMRERMGEEGPSPGEDALVSQIMRQMDVLGQ